MKAELTYEFRDVTPEGHLIQMVVWQLRPAPRSSHGLKYRLVYIVDGIRVVGFDNERGKGDHCHLDGVEHPYRFQSLERLIEDFIAEIEKRRAP